MQQPPPLADFGPLDAVPHGLDARRAAHDHRHHDPSLHCAPTALSATAEFSSGASPMARTAAYSSTSASVRASGGQGPLSSLPIARSYAHAGREQERSRHRRVSTEISPRERQRADNICPTTTNGAALTTTSSSGVPIPAGVRSTRFDEGGSIKGVPWWRRCRVPFFSFGIAFVPLVVGSVATLVLVLNPMIHERSTASVETATRGALVAVAERVARPFRILQTVLRLHALDNEASGDTCADGRTSLEPSRRYITKYATSMETSIGTFPIWIAYHMFRAPRPSGETWTFCGCTSGAYGYDKNHCDSFNHSHLVETKLGLPVDLTVVRTGIYNRTTAAYMPPIYALREHLDAEGVWSQPQPYVYPGANKFVTTLQIHMPIRFRYNWEFDVDPILMETPNRNAGGPVPPVYTLRPSPRAGLNASDPALALPGQPFARKVSMTESIEVLLEGINALLLATAPDHAEVALIHAATEILIASTYQDIPIFDLANGQPEEWHARRTPNAVLNAATADVFDRHLKSEITEALAADARREPLSQHLGVVTPSVHMTESWIVTAGLLTPGHGFVLCFIIITERQPYYQRVLDARLSTFLIAAFVCVFCIVTVLVILLLIHRSLASLREATVAAATLQLDSKTLRKRGKSVVQEIADLQDSFAAMNDMLVRTESLQRRHSSLNQAGSSSSSMTHVLTAGSAPPTSAAGLAYRDRNRGDVADQLGDDDDELEFIDEDDRDKPTNEAPPVAKMQLRMPKMASHQRYVAVLHINVVGFHSLVSALEAPRGRGPNSHSPARSSTATARTSARHTPLARPPLAPPRQAADSLAGDKGTPLVGEGPLVSYANYHWAPNTPGERRKNAAPDAAVPLPDAFKVVGDQASARGAWCRSVAILSRSLRAAAASKKTSGAAVRAEALPSCPGPTVEDEIGTMMECTVSRSCTTHAAAVFRMHRAALAEPSPVGSAASAAGRCLGPLWEV